MLQSATPFGKVRCALAPVADDKGVPLLVVSRQLAHASPQITATIYAHLASDDELDAVGDVFEAVRRA